jgi:LPXTG-motif cell wall-anchored protein
VASEREWPVAVSGAPAESPSATSATSSASAGTDAGTAAAVAGGAALLIVAAGFTVRRHRKVEPKPV